MQLYPSFGLSKIIKHYLIINSEENNNVNYRLFTDGNLGLVFQFHNSALEKKENNSSIPLHSFLYGQLTQYNDVKATGKLDMLIVVLQPDALYAVLKLAAVELNNETVPLHTIFGQDGIDLEDQVRHAPTIRMAIQAIEDMFKRRLIQQDGLDRLTKEALMLITQYQGNITMAALYNKLPVTERQLERKFKQQVGLSPKKYTDVIKFQHFLKTLQKLPPGHNLAAGIYACGYYDQAHLNNSFKKYVGITPLQYRRNNNILAINFLAI